MKKKVNIKEIIEFLEVNNYEFNFIGNEDDDIFGYSTLFNYREDSMTFVSSLNNFSDYRELFHDKNIQLIISDPTEDIYDCFVNVIQINNPKSLFFLILENFFEEKRSEDFELIDEESHSYKGLSYISDKAVIGENVRVGIGCVIEENVYIGDNTEIHHNVVIRGGTKIGSNCTIFSGAIIGESGFNPLKAKNHKRNLVKHYGGITIGNDVHIGDNCTISRGAIDDTVIKNGVKINKQVVVAHNVFIGENTIFTAPTFVAGSVSIGRNCHVAASVIRNQCKIGDNAVLGLGAVVIKDVPAGSTVVGNPAKLLKK